MDSAAREARLGERLRESERAREALEAEARRIRVQSEQWRKAAEEAAAVKTAFDVKIEKYDAAAKIKIIKEVRAMTDLGLKEAKELVEKAPVVVRAGLPKEEAEALAAKLKAAGAAVALE